MFRLSSYCLRIRPSLVLCFLINLPIVKILHIYWGGGVGGAGWHLGRQLGDYHCLHKGTQTHKTGAHYSCINYVSNTQATARSTKPSTRYWETILIGSYSFLFTNFCYLPRFLELVRKGTLLAQNGTDWTRPSTEYQKNASTRDWNIKWAKHHWKCKMTSTCKQGAWIYDL